MSEVLPSAGWRLDRQVSVAVVFAFVVQTSAALLWAGGAAERITTLEGRLDKQSGVAERLARLEAQSDATRMALARIEAKLDEREGRR